jgi:hypothetical protein
MDAAARKFLEECGTSCPRCGSTLIGRGEPHFGEWRDERPYMLVEGYCARCPATWMETYRLESIAFPRAAPR